MKATAAVILSLCIATTATADDWPQWMGPQRDNVWREEGLVSEFPEGGPRVVWRVPVAGGYAGPAVANGRVFVPDYVTEENVRVDNFQRQTFTGNERVLCLDEATGREKWRHEYRVAYTISYPAGPRCTPTVDGDRLYTLGAEGDLVCLEAASGRVIWSKNLPQEYHTKTAIWGYTGHPLVDGEKLICIAGGAGSHVVALNKNTGAEIWRALTSPEQGYSPPTIITAGGRRQLILLRPDAVTSVDPESGREYWSIPCEFTSGLAVMSPIHWRDNLYIGGFANKNMLLKLAADHPAAELVWRDQPQQAIAPVTVQPAIDDGTLYGFDHNGRLYAAELPSGKRLWDTTAPLAGTRGGGSRPANSGTAMIVRQADRYWLFTENGDLILANLSLAGYEEVDRAHILEPTNNAWGRNVVWTAPAFANRRMYVRNDQECVCVDLAAE